MVTVLVSAGWHDYLQLDAPESRLQQGAYFFRPDRPVQKTTYDYILLSSEERLLIFDLFGNIQSRQTHRPKM
ncbi:hypothetical protein EYF80_041491 [Liparis tanakae]|uniref:Uncharacterized protein n=1 Tax=Liparis tanakae TaxID=230148 RepID=A0A4Z2G488_9TELE|nr:hypothetical protein EYF80_041491 [Liparis tanakae]